MMTLPSRTAARAPGERGRGFTLIELLIVVVIIATLASIALFRMYSAKDETYVAALKQDLRNLVVAQEAYFERENGYASDLAELGALFRSSEGVRVEVDSASSTGWGGHAVHQVTGETCHITSDAPRAPDCDDG